MRPAEVTMLNAVVATGASSAVGCLEHNKMTFHIIASSVSTGGTMKIQHTLDGTNYYGVATINITSNGVSEVVVENQVYKKVRANLTARTDGTYTVLMLAGN